MKKIPLHEVEQVVTDETSVNCQIVSSHPVSGGCIHETFRLDSADGRRFMIKMNRDATAQVFEAERAGLESLAAGSPVPRVPQVIAQGMFADACTAFLIMQWVETGSRPGGFSERFARELAALHRAATHERFGFEHDNFIGSTPQPNSWRNDWPKFWRENRLGYQFQLASANGYADAFSTKKIESFLQRVSELIGECAAEPPSLIHGDLWSGNYLVGERGEPVLIDPAVYYANREAEFGMAVLFGGFDRRFYEAYDEAFPFQDGYQERFEIYKLYHLLNHLNLFGSSYLAGCVSIVNRFS